MKTGKDEEGRDTKWMWAACEFIAIIGSAFLIITAVGAGSSPSNVTLTFVISEYDVRGAAGGANLGQEKLTFLANNATQRPVFIGFMGVETNGPSGWVSDRDAYMSVIARPMKKLNPGDTRFLSMRVSAPRSQPGLGRRVCVSVYTPPTFLRRVQRAGSRLLENVRRTAHHKNLWPASIPEPAAEFTVEIDPALARQTATNSPEAIARSDPE